MAFLPQPSGSLALSMTAQGSLPSGPSPDVLLPLGSQSCLLSATQDRPPGRHTGAQSGVQPAAQTFYWGLFGEGTVLDPFEICWVCSS